MVRQSKATTAEASTGEPVFSVIHSPCVKRSCKCTPLRPANRSASFSSLAGSVLTQNTPFCASTGAELLRRLRQTSSIAGASDTEQTAVAVKPLLPAATRGGDDMHGGAEPRHRLAERQRLDARDRPRRDRGESAVHGIVGPLVDPAHYPAPSPSAKSNDPVSALPRDIGNKRQCILDAPPSRSMTKSHSAARSSSGKPG